ncbi:peptide deformylase [Micrococcales bacterium 31B]|nr:peptide deformylase [Micrococcales bacterium 31B]
MSVNPSASVPAAKAPTGAVRSHPAVPDSYQFEQHLRDLLAASLHAEQPTGSAASASQKGAEATGVTGAGATEATIAGLPQIVQAGHWALRAGGAPVEWVAEGEGAQEPTGSRAPIWLPRPTLEGVAEVMLRVMHAAPGVGVAAPQIGLPLRLAVIGDPAPGDPELLRALERGEVTDYAVVNPRYEPEGDEVLVHWEGCLSVAGWMVLVPRYRTIRAHWQDLAGESHSAKVRGWHARIFQHETDHLDGVLCHDLALARSLCQAGAVGGYASPADFADAMGVRLAAGQRWAVPPAG